MLSPDCDLVLFPMPGTTISLNIRVVLIFAAQIFNFFRRKNIDSISTKVFYSHFFQRILVSFTQTPVYSFSCLLPHD